MAQKMGLGKFDTDVCLMRKFRWLFFIDGISDDGTNALPPDKGARPSLNFKEIEVQHLNEIVYFALFDLKPNKNPVFGGLKSSTIPATTRAIGKFPIHLLGKRQQG